jgi:protein-S-isoprenylcysteine O-methyltransferase Ste14
MSITRITYRLRGFLISLPFIFALFSFSFETENGWFIWPVGVSIFLLGLLVRIWAQQHLRYRLKVRKLLTTTGPYSFVRNPIYLGNILIGLGLIVTSELLWFVPITFLYCFCVYSLVASYEERHLLEKYGESYRRYMFEVPRWFPQSIRFKNLGLRNEYLRSSIIAEIHCFLALLPYLAKEIIGDIIQGVTLWRF